MKLEDVQVAIAEATKFLERADLFIKSESDGFTGSAIGGALKRQSMELTRALSAMRRPWR